MCEDRGNGMGWQRQATGSNGRLFQSAPVAICELDVRGLEAWYNQLRAGGVTALRPLLESDPLYIRQGIGQVTLRRANPASVRLFEARDEQQLSEQIHVALGSAAPGVLTEALLARWEHRLTFTALTQLLTLQGTPIQVLAAIAVPVEDGQPDLSDTLVIFTDLTASLRAEEALRESEERFRLLAETVPAIIYTGRPDGTCDYSNPRFYEYTGLPVGAAEGDGWVAAVHPDDLARVERLWQTSVATGAVFECEHRLRAADGSYHWFLGRARPIRDAEGRITKWFGTSTDVDQVKRMEQELAEREALLRLAEEAGNVGSFAYDLRSEQVHISPQLWAIYGEEPGSVPATQASWLARVLPEDWQRIQEVIRTRGPGQSQEQFEYRIRRPDGEIRWLESRGRTSFDAQGNLTSMVGVNVDVTERHRAEEILRESEAFYRTLLETLPVTVVLADPQGKISYVSPAALEMFGLEPGEGLGTTPTDWIAPEHHDVVRQRMHAVLVERRPQPPMEYRMLRRDGSSLWAQLTSAPLLDPLGQLTGVVTVCQDITARKLAVEKLQDREEVLRLALEVSHTGWWHWDLVTGRVTADMLAKALFGLPPEAEVTFDTFLRTLAPSEVPRILTELPGAMNSGADFQSEFHLIWPDGSHHWVQARGRTLSNGAEQPHRALGVLMDVTEHKRAEERLSQLNQTLEQQVAERTAVAERRASQLQGLASELAKAEQRERRRLAKILHDHFQQLLYAAKLKTGQLRGRLQEERSQRLVQETLQLLDESIAESRSLAVELSPPVLYDRGLIAALEWLARDVGAKHNLPVQLALEPDAEPRDEGIRVFLFDAIRELLLNVVKHAQASSARIVLQERGGEQLRAEVSDTGRGFEPALLERPDQPGGFGLRTIRERLQLLGGRWEVHAAPGQGSEFCLEVPRGSASRGAERSREAVAVASDLALGTGQIVETPTAGGEVRVLVADDHRVVREGLITVLQEQPEIEVVGEAADGQQACELALYMKPDVVLMDVSMPGMDGIEATRRITQALPQVRVIGLSMYHEADKAAAMRQAGAVGYLSKEVASGELVAAVLAETGHHG